VGGGPVMDYLSNCVFFMAMVNDMTAGHLPWNQRDFDMACKNVVIYSALAIIQEKEK
jgi:hypothetical protein